MPGERSAVIRFFRAAGMLALVLLAAACTKPESRDPGKPRGADGQRLEVVASLFPLYDFARQIGQERADVTLLLPPGVEPHSFEPKPSDVVLLGRADLVIYTNKYMEPWIDDILKGVNNPGLLVVDASRGISLYEGKEEAHGRDHGHGHESGRAVDPHIWLDLSNAIVMVDTILEGFVAKDPANGDFYRKNAEAYKAKLAALDRRFSETLNGCRRRTVVSGGHFTFGYLARRYGLAHVSAYGFSPDAEPTPQGIIAVSRTLRQHGLKHLFYEELITPRVAETIARETGAALLMLHGAHNISREDFERGTTFLSLMEQNLHNLTIGLQCR